MWPKSSLPASQKPATFPYRSNINAVHALQSYLFKVRFNIILLPILQSFKWFLSLRSPHQNPVCMSLLHHKCYIPRLFYISRFHCPNL
jgi:hypothetical protein